MKMKWKKIMAFIMVFAIILSNTGVSNIYQVMAEQAKDVAAQQESTKVTTSEASTTEQPASETATGKKTATEQTTRKTPTSEASTTQQPSTEKLTSETVTTEQPVSETTTRKETTTEQPAVRALAGETTETQQPATAAATNAPTTPVITLMAGSTEIGTGMKVKTGTQITVSSNVTDDTWIVEIYDKDNQKIVEKDDDGNEIPRILKNGVTYAIGEGKTTFKFINGDTSLVRVVDSFQSYTYKAVVNNVSYSISEQDITLKDGKKLEEAELNKAYRVQSVKGFTVEDNINITLTETQPEIMITANSIIAPKIKKIENNYFVGDTVEISVENDTEAYMDLWKCMYAVNGTSVEIPKSDGKYKLEFEERGEYSFYFECNGTKSGSVSTTVYSKVEFKNDDEDKENITLIKDIYYTNQSIINIVCDLQSEDLRVDGGETNDQHAGLRLVMKVELDADKLGVSDAVKRDVTIRDAWVEDSKGNKEFLYNADALKDKKIKIEFAIKKPNLLIQPVGDELARTFRTGEIRWEDSDYDIFQIIETELETKSEQLTGTDKVIYSNILINDADLKSTDNGDYTLTINDLSKGENETYYRKEYDNFNLLFDKNTFNISDTFPEEIDEPAIRAAINMQYDGKTLCLESTEPLNEDGQYNLVGNWEITAAIYPTSEYYSDNTKKQGYCNIYFKRINYDNIENMGSVVGATPDSLTPDFPDKENIMEYSLIFSDVNNSFPTVAAVVRIIRRTYMKEHPHYAEETAIKLNDREYQVINLFYDDTPVELTFEEPKTALTVESSQTDLRENKVVCGQEEEIYFNLVGEEDTERTVEYGYIDLDKINNLKIEELKNMSTEKLGITEMIKLEAPLSTEEVNDSRDKEDEDSDEEKKVKLRYVIKAPIKEGHYAVYIKVTNGSNVDNIHISNGFVVDVTPPEMQITFKNPEGDVTTLSTDEDKRTYFQGGTITAEVIITDANQIEKEIVVTATDKDGNTISEIINPYEETPLEDTTDSEEEKPEEGNPEEDNSGETTTSATRILSFQLKFSKNANYTLQIKAKDDPVGNTTDSDTYYFTIDNDRPKGEIKVNGKQGKVTTAKEKDKGIIDIVIATITETWYEIVETVTYKWFSKETADVELTGWDQLSDVTCYYYIAEKATTCEQLQQLDSADWEKYTGNKVKVSANKRKIVYGKIVDKAGNVAYLSTDGLLTDTEKPDIIIEADKEANKNGFYRTDVNYTVKVKDFTDAIVVDYSGLQYIAYTVSKNGEVILSKDVYKDTKETVGEESKEFDINLKASEINSNDVVITVVAVDKAGNRSEKPQKLSIDNVKPEITVTYDNNNVVNGTYYNAKRTATIQIKERNLNTKDVQLEVISEHGSKASIGKWTHTDNIGKSDEAIYECKVTFSADDDYQFKVSCVDKAGNESKDDYSSKFTIDTTAPVVEVNYSDGNGEYHNQEVTATITIKEHNFDGSNVSVDVEATDTQSTPSVSQFSEEGDNHTATVHFNTDGTYQLSVSYEDKAGNAANSHEGSRFVIDLTQPEIEIQNVKNQSAYKDEVKPVITFTDKNYDASLVALSVTGSNRGKVELEKLNMVKSVVDEGEQYALEFPVDSATDDLYTLTATMSDKAGNETQEVIEFSVNRYGSIYTLDSTTGKWLENGVCSYIKEEQSVVIVETNVNDIESRTISYSVGGVSGTTVNIPELSDCTQEEKSNNLYYEMTRNEQSNGWVQYRYEIKADNFSDEGIYNITIHSKDAVGNETSNISNLHNNNKLEMQFAVDKTAPDVVFSGTEENALYKETKHIVLLDVQDNIALEQVTVYLNGEEYDNYLAEDISDFADGLIAITVPQSTSTQTVQVAARDMAGNMLGDVTAGVADKACEKISFLVTTNKFVQYMHTTWLLVVTGVGCVAIVGGIVAYILYFRRKRK